MSKTDQDKADFIIGDAKALIEMRTMLTKDEDAETATRELKKSARAGNVAAQVLLGDLHMNGEGVPHNYSMAETWYRLAADAGNAEGQYKLALMYQNRLGLPLDLKQAREWLMKAAALGHWQARKTLEKKGIEPPPVRPMQPEKKSAAEEEAAKTAAEALAKKALEKAAEKLKLDEMMAKAMAFSQKADRVLAKLRAGAAKGTAVDAMAVTITGNEPPPENTAPAPAIRDLVSRYAAAVNAKDLARLKQLIKPEYAACANDGNKAAYDDYLADGFAFEIPPGYTVRFGKLDPAAALPFLDLMTYPVKPGHYVRIDLKDPPTGAGAGAVELATSVIQYIAGGEGDWSLVFGCPTSGGFEKMRQASGAAAKG
ncbi:MAG: sel1 repeat family protein [Proteobacteria bacterium]|nr:sel1 repeat family protein [Pseudomonadota bacterium]